MTLETSTQPCGVDTLPGKVYFYLNLCHSLTDLVDVSTSTYHVNDPDTHRY